MPIDNPFFWLDLSRHRRRRSEVAFRLLGSAAAGALWLLGSLLAGLLTHWLERVPLRPVLFSFDWLVLLHAVACMAAGGYGGDLLFGREVRNRTLTALQLLPLAPKRFLARKLAFPLWAVGVTWAAGIPLAIVAALLDLTTVTAALHGLLLAGGAGLAALVVTLLGTSGDMAPPLDPFEKQVRDTEAFCRGFLVIGASGLALLLAYYGWSAPDRWPCFGLRLQVWVPGGLLTVLLGLAAVNRGPELLLGELSSYRRSAFLAAAGLAVIYLLLLGVFWSGLPLWGRALTVVGPLALSLLNLWQLHKRSPTASNGTAAVTPARKEDPWTEAELTWLQAHWNNPLLLRDLRASLRGQSFRGRMRTTLIAQPVLLIAFYFMFKWLGSAVISSSASWLFTPLITGGGIASTLWAKEKKSGALPLLLLTPLSSREILAGRLTASLLLALPLLLFPGLVLLSVVGWFTTTRFWMVGPVALALLPSILSVWVSNGCGNATAGQKVANFTSHPSFHPARGGALLLLPLGGAAIMWTARFGPLPCCAVALLIAGLYAAFALFTFREHVRKLEAYRRSDIDPGAI